MMSTRTSPLAAVALLLAACGGKVVVDGSAVEGTGGAGGQIGVTVSSVAASSSTGANPLEEAACTKFCATAAEKGCPSAGDCQARCLAMFVNGCVSEVASALDCSASLLTEDCYLAYPEDAFDCSNTVTSASTCLSDVAGFGCGMGETTLLEGGACVGKGSCDIGVLSVACDAQGTCTCVAGGQNVGTCQNLIEGVEFCSVTSSCCAALFPK